MASNPKTDSSIANKSILLTISSLLTKLTLMVSTMIITRLLDETAYGTYKQVFLTYNVVLPFLALGLAQGVFYFMPFEKKRVRGRMNDCYAVYLTTGLIYCLFLLLGGSRLIASAYDNPELSSLILISIPYIIMDVAVQSNYAVFNVMNRVRLYMVYSVCSGFLSGLTLIAAILISPTAKSVVIASVGFKVLSNAVLIFLTGRILPKDESRPDLSSIIELLKFSVPVGIAYMISTLSVNLDSVFVSAMRSTEEYAVYTVGAHELILIGVISSSICVAITPAMRVAVAEGRLERCSELFVTAGRRMATVLVPMMCFFWVWSREFLTFVYSEKYIGAVWIFRVYLVYFLLRISASNQVFASLGVGKYILACSAVTCVLNAILNYLGIKAIGSIGAALATVASGTLVFVFMNIPMLSKKLNLPLKKAYPLGLVLKSLAIGMAGGYAVELLLGRRAVPWLIGVLKLSSFIGNAELVSTIESALNLGVCAVLFAAVYIPLALLTMRGDYEWMVGKVKEIFGKSFRKKAKASTN